MTHESDVEDSYFRLLVDFVGQKGQEDLLGVFHATSFMWLVPNDVNRAEDGRELRLDMLRNMGVKDVTRFDSMEITVLEVLAALAYRASWQDDSSVSDWFETFLFNLELDSQPREGLEHTVDDILADWMQRKFDFDGQGGLFPLRKPVRDQRREEIWNQMSAYINEDLELRGYFD